jgi:hypothetical protein
MSHNAHKILRKTGSFTQVNAEIQQPQPTDDTAQDATQQIAMHTEFQ